MRYYVQIRDTLNLKSYLEAFHCPFLENADANDKDLYPISIGETTTFQDFHEITNICSLAGQSDSVATSPCNAVLAGYNSIQ